MKQLLEFIPVIIFFVVYQMDEKTLSLGDWQYTFNGIFSATAALIIATFMQLILTWLIFRELEKRLVWTSVAVLAFGGATLVLQNELFIQWKPTVFNWGMAIAFAGSQFIGKRNLLERIMGSQLELPSHIWARICWVWVAHFSVVGILNLVVAFNFEEATWVSYKLYSGFGLTLFIMVITALMMGPWLRQDATKRDVIDSELRP